MNSRQEKGLKLEINFKLISKLTSMKNIILMFFPVYLLLISCSSPSNNGSTEQWKNEIFEAEQSFANMAREEGISKAFLTYAAEDAVLMRSDSLVIGKTDIRAYFEDHGSGTSNVSLTWKPDFVDVAASGDLGYTYGYYTLSYSDESGATMEKTGVFHTVWRRQSDGAWRFVWD